MRISPPTDDLDWILERRETELTALDGSTIVIYGGTGFIGKWLLSTLNHAQTTLGVELDIFVISRNVDAALSQFYALKEIRPKFISTHNLAEIPQSSHVIFAATSATDSNPAELAASAELARAAIESLEKFSTPPNFLNLSSGAVLNLLQPGPNSLRSYQSTKLEIEKMVQDASVLGKIQGSNPRLFAFAGPLLPLDSKYAIGNFMKNAIEGMPIRVLGNSTTLRSYLYPSELVAELITLMCNPASSNIEIGGSDPISIGELASLVSNIFGGIHVEKLGEDSIPSTYLPSERVNIVKKQEIPISAALVKWKNWLIKD